MIPTACFKLKSTFLSIRNNKTAENWKLIFLKNSFFKCLMCVLYDTFSDVLHIYPEIIFLYWSAYKQVHAGYEIFM